MTVPTEPPKAATPARTADMTAAATNKDLPSASTAAPPTSSSSSTAPVAITPPVTPVIGDRILAGNCPAIIRWGPAPLPGQGSDSWFGIEYEEDGKGKHDGLLKKGDVEQRFFQCLQGRGSFVKAHKVVIGRTVMEGLEWKYSDEDKPLIVEDFKTQRRDWGGFGVVFYVGNLLFQVVKQMFFF